MDNVVIIGADCAGYTAGIYAARAELAPALITGQEFGGQLALTTKVENYPGFSEGVMGAQLMEEFRKQSERFGARIYMSSVEQCHLTEGGPHTVQLTNGDTLETRACIVASGARPRQLGLASEKALQNKGVSYCATCDGALYRDVPVVVVGGGDSAMEEALFLARFASKVTVIHRRDKLRASTFMQQQAFDNDNIEFCWNSVVQEVLDVEQAKVTGVVVRNVPDGTTETIPCEACFPSIGHIPNTGFLKNQLTLDKEGYLKLPDPGRSESELEGVFVAGDCADSRYRQAVTAAGMGCRAAVDVERWLQTVE